MSSLLFPVYASYRPHQARGCHTIMRGREPFLDLLESLSGGYSQKSERNSPLNFMWKTCPHFSAGSRPKPANVPRQPWLHRLRIQGYDPKDIEVNVDGENVKVYARHEEVEGDNMDKYETRRTIKIPENVNKDKLSSFLVDGGHLVITAPFMDMDNEQKPAKNAMIPDENLDVKIKVQPDSKSSERSADTSELKTLGTLVHDIVKDYVDEDMKSMSASNSAVNTDQGADVKSERKHDKTDDDKDCQISETENEEETGNEAAQEITDMIETAVVKVTTEKDVSANDTQEETGKEDFNLEETYVITSPPPSPVQSEYSSPLDKQGLDEDSKTPKKTAEEELAPEENLPPLMHSKEIIEFNGEQMYQISMNLKNFKPENVTVRFKDNVLSVDAEKEWNNEGVFTTQKVHRKFLIPEKGNAEKIVVKMNDDGFVKVTVPLQAETLEEIVKAKKQEDSV